MSGTTRSLLYVKARAWATHLGLSILVIAPVFLLAFLLWFPQPYFEILATARIFAVLIGVDLVLGPLLTFIVYRPGKKGLKFDLAVIVMLQLAALGYGTWNIHSERPRYVVFAVDRYQPLAARDIDFAAAGLDGFGTARWRGPVYAYAQMPEGEAFQRFQEEVLFEGKPDLDRRPEFWHPLESRRAAVLAAAEPLSTLARARQEHAEALRARARELGLDPETARYVPVMGKGRELVAFLDPDSAEILGVLDVDPF